ncbi:hypothetical protein [Herbidospora daliensis]|uniref:hypothetical protein n=1 Tax=Herbidospora daliensis TaxID=295585 RepID=UPI0012F90B8C|nr:hypothetical protein [Herbidospora daliensis]
MSDCATATRIAALDEQALMAAQDPDQQGDLAACDGPAGLLLEIGVEEAERRLGHHLTELAA